MTEASRPSEHNPIFDHFVEPDLAEGEQLKGLLAYALYKRSKREWAGTKLQKPTEEQLNNYVETWTKSRLDGLSDQAERLLEGFASAYVDAAEPAIRADALKGSFWAAVWPAITAAFIYSVGLIIFTVILKYSGVDVLEIFHRVGEGKP